MWGNPRAPVSDFGFNLFYRDALAAIQLIETLLDGLAKLQLIDGIAKRGVRRQFFRDL